MSAEPMITLPPLRLILDTGGAIVTIGRTNFTPGDGQRAIEVPDNCWEAFLAVATKLTEGEEITYDEARRAFGTRARAKSQVERDADTTRALVVEAARSAVGVNLTALTATQQRALLAVLLWKAGALNPDGSVRKLADWAG